MIKYFKTSKFMSGKPLRRTILKLQRSKMLYPGVLCLIETDYFTKTQNLLISVTTDNHEFNIVI